MTLRQKYPPVKLFRQREQPAFCGNGALITVFPGAVFGGEADVFKVFKQDIHGGRSVFCAGKLKQLPEAAQYRIPHLYFQPLFPGAVAGGDDVQPDDLAFFIGIDQLHFLPGRAKSQHRQKQRKQKCCDGKKQKQNVKKGGTPPVSAAVIRIHVHPSRRVDFPKNKKIILRCNMESKKIWEPEKPRLENLTEADLEDCTAQALSTGEDVEGKKFVRQSLRDYQGGVLQFTGCLFEHCALEELEFQRLDFVDCVFDRCEMGNLNLSGFALQRVHFQKCRMIGDTFSKCSLGDVLFEGCMADYFALAQSKLDRVVFSDCSMKESLYGNLQLKRVKMEGCNLSQSQWSYTPLKGMDLTGCNLEGIRIELTQLRGLKVNASQALMLAKLLGIEITDQF